MQKSIFPALLTTTLFFLCFTFSTQARAFLTVQESNEISAVGKYKLGVEPQVRTSGGNGTNFSGFFDAPINEEMSIRAQIGAGDTDFVGGGSFKWVPIPDYKTQPAIGGKVSVIYFRESNDNFFTYRFEPIISKKFETEKGTFIPYGAIPLMLTTGNGSSVTGLQLAAGTEYITPNADNMTFGAEFGVNARDSFSYISGFVTIYIDEVKPLTKKK